MNRKRAVVLAGLAIAGLGTGFYVVHARQEAIVLTGIVTTNDVIVSPQISGQLSRLLVQEGDAVTSGQLLAVIAPEELRAESEYYEHTAAGAGSQVEGKRRSPRRKR